MRQPYHSIYRVAVLITAVVLIGVSVAASAHPGHGDTSTATSTACTVELEVEYKGETYTLERNTDTESNRFHPLSAENGLDALQVADDDYVTIRSRNARITVRTGSNRTHNPYEEQYNDIGQPVIWQFHTTENTSEHHRILADTGSCIVSGAVTVRPLCTAGNWDGTACRTTYNVAAVPLFMEQHAFDTFYEDVERAISFFATVGPLQEESHPRRRVNIQYMEPDEVETPPNRKCFFTLNPRTSSVNMYAVQTARETYGSRVDSVVALVDGGVELPSILAPFSSTVSGCALPGLAAAVAQRDSKLYQDQTLVHELGHTFGLCHTKGVRRNGTCQDVLPRQPRVGSVLTLNPVKSLIFNYLERGIDHDFTFTDTCRNDFTAAGPEAVMNYCSQNTRSAVAFSPEEYGVLQEQFEEAGWIE